MSYICGAAHTFSLTMTDTTGQNHLGAMPTDVLLHVITQLTKARRIVDYRIIECEGLDHHNHRLIEYGAKYLEVPEGFEILKVTPVTFSGCLEKEEYGPDQEVTNYEHLFYVHLVKYG